MFSKMRRKVKNLFNVDIRDAIRSKGLYGYQVAEMIGMTEFSFSRLLARKELSPERKEQIFKAIGGEHNAKNAHSAK